MKKQHFIFILLFFSVSFYYGYYEILQKKPQSIHRWRQTDSASIAYNFYSRDYNIFHPEVLYQVADQGKSGYTVGEFPGYYFFIAGLWKVFGHSDVIYRLVSFLLFFIGIYHLFKLSLLYIKDTVWSIFIALTFMTSTVVMYYANSFTTDIPALSLSITGFYYFQMYLIKRKRSLLALSLGLFAFAGLIKIVTLMPFLCILGVYFFNTIRLTKIEYASYSFKLNYRLILAFSVIFILIFAWYAYAVHYNSVHQVFFFSTQTFPIWDYSFDRIVNILDYINEKWLSDYFNFSAFGLFSLFFIFLLINFRKVDKYLRIITSLLFLQTVCYILLWFFCFEQHDYYFIHLMPFLMFLTISTFQLLKEHCPNLFQSTILKVILLFILACNIQNTKYRLKERYEGYANEYPIYQYAHSAAPYLKKIGIKPEDKIISLPDETPNYTLYLFQQRGWSEAGQNNLSAEGVEKCIGLGAKYLICTGYEVLSRPYLKPYLQHKIGQHGDVTIYKLHQSLNEIQKSINLDAE